MCSSNKVQLSDSLIAVLAGRRPDAQDADAARFPIINLLKVKSRVLETLTNEGIKILVCSAACGADLLSLEAANQLGIDTHVFLPFSPEIFKQKSVIDRPGDWGRLYDMVVKEAKGKEHLYLLNYEANDNDAFFKTNEEMISFAKNLADGAGVTSIVVWDGQPRGGGDSTQQFAEKSWQAGFRRIEIPTL